LRFALAFVAAAVAAWATSDSTWLPLHLFLAGGVVLAISGVSLMLTVTWSAAPAPRDRVAWLQRLAVAVGAAGFAAARHLELEPAIVTVAGAVYLVGVAVLAVLLVLTVRRGVERRFDPAVVAYVAALIAGVGGVFIGIAMAIDAPSAELRNAHATINLLGLIGLVIAGTLPFFAATVGRSRTARHLTSRRVTMVIGWQVTALTVAVAGMIADIGLAAAGLAAYAWGIGAVLWLAPRPTRRQLQWAGPRLLGLWAGAAWWMVAVVAAAIDVSADEASVFTGSQLSVLVVAGYGQILWGSLAYLLPMLRGGGHERLAEGFATTRSWLALLAANVAGVAYLASASVVAMVAVAVWLIDSATRGALVGFGRASRRPSEGAEPM
jgi:nitrite reductase (NO-forming)